MKYSDSIARARRSLSSAKTRTILTSLAIAVGAFTITVSLAAGEGARQYADTLIKSNVNPQALFIVKDKAIVEGGGRGGSGLKEYKENSAELRGQKYDAVTQKDVEAIKNNPDIQLAYPMYRVNAQYLVFEGNDKKLTGDVQMYDPTVRVKTEAGELPPLNTQIGDESAVLPVDYLESAGFKTAKDAIGKKITLHVVKQPTKVSEEEIKALLTKPNGASELEAKLAPEKRDVVVTIAAVTAKSTTALTASNAIFLSENKTRELSEFLTKDTDAYQNYFSAGAVVKEGVDPQKVKETLEKTGLTVKTAKDLQSVLFSFVNILQGIVLGFGAIALLASVFGIINTQYISVLERTREIGLMKALGMRGRHVSRLFQLEAAWIGLLGGLLGTATAFAIGTALNPTISDKLNLGGQALLVFVPWQIAAMIASLILIAMIAGWFPARKAAKLNPIEALRTE